MRCAIFSWRRELARLSPQTPRNLLRPKRVQIERLDDTRVAGLARKDCLQLLQAGEPGEFGMTSIASPSVRRNARRFRFSDIAQQRHQKRGNDKGDHNGPERVGVSQRRGFAIGKLPELFQRRGVTGLETSGN